MGLSDLTLFLHVDDDAMAEVCLDALLGPSFQVRAAARGPQGREMLSSILDWVVVDFEIPDSRVSEYLLDSGRLGGNHSFVLLSGATTGLLIWEKLQGLEDEEHRGDRMNARTFLSRYSAAACEKTSASEKS